MIEQLNSPQNWHQILGEGWEKFLSPVNISVFTELQVMSQPPCVDILLFRRDEPTWTVEQMERLPDGIRQSTACHILIELKYTESINQKAFSQAITYDYLYKENKQLTDQEVQTFVLSGKKPQAETRKAYEYDEMLYKGVYKTQRQLEKRIQLISLNELADTPYNAAFKLFATHQKEKQKAFELLKQSRDVSSIPKGLKSLLSGLLILGEQDMIKELTPEQVREIGQFWGKDYFLNLSAQEKVELISTLPPEERFIGLKPEERFIGLKPEERLMGLKPKERLAGLSHSEIEELEEQIKKLKQQKKG